jgi:hypothetical protein
LQRQSKHFGYPGRIPRGQDHIATAHLKVTFGWLLFFICSSEDMVETWIAKIAKNGKHLLFAEKICVICTISERNETELASKSNFKEKKNAKTTDIRHS